MLVSAFILGLLGSFHCIGMCGPITFMLPVDRNNALKKIAQIGIYHTGRLLAYGIIGFIFGLIGKGLYIFGFQQKLSILVGIVIILLVLIPRRFLKQFRVSTPIYRIISKIKSELALSFRKKSMDTFLTIGFLNGFLPCGLVYMALLGAVTFGNSLSGSLYMVFFGIGTLPLMTTAIYASQWIKASTRHYLQRAIPVIMVMVGLWFIVRGLGLNVPYLSPAAIQQLVSASLNCH